MTKKFTLLARGNCRELTPGKRIIEHGIEYRKRSDGDGTFSVSIRVDGARIHRVLGRESEGMTRSVAERFVAEARIEARHLRLSCKPFDEAASEAGIVRLFARALAGDHRACAKIVALFKEAVALSCLDGASEPAGSQASAT